MHLRRMGVDAYALGDPMSFWRTMPKGMHLRSNWTATSIGEPHGPLSLDSYVAETGDPVGSPVPLDKFVEYGNWFQQRAVPDLDARRVARVDRGANGFELELSDGERMTARRVVVACGIEPFAWRPRGFDSLPQELVSHTADHEDLARFAGRRVAVVGGGQSAFESAALMAEAGADVDVFVRRSRVVWLKANSPKNVLGPIGPVVYAPTDVGPLWYSRLVATPDLFRRLPRRAQTRIAYRSIRPACSNWVRVRLDDVKIHLDTSVSVAGHTDDTLRLAVDGSEREFDRLVLGTGYKLDIARYPFLAPGLLAGIERVAGYPILARGLESSVAGLHFLGAPAAWSFGPTQRFVSGSWYGGRTVARAIASANRGVAA
jgi:cation diffusion facilitator CzcD-associated flavoprotein CzcO